MCGNARIILLEIDELLERMMQKKDPTSPKKPVDSRPSKVRWLRGRSAMLRLTSQLKPIVASLTATANILRDIASDRRLHLIETTLNIEKAELVRGAQATVEQGALRYMHRFFIALGYDH